MPISPDQQATIDSLVGQVNPKTLQKLSGITVEQFIEVFANHAARSVKDWTALEAAGYPIEKRELNFALIESIAMAYGVRVGSHAEVSPERREYNEMLEQCVQDKKIMMRVLNRIINITNNLRLRKFYQKIASGNSITNNVCDVLSLANKLQEFPDLCGSIRPDRVEVNAEFLNAAVDRASRLITMRGFVGSGPKSSEAVEYLNKLISVAIKLHAELMEYVEAAMMNNPEHVERYYGPMRSRKSDSSQEKSSEESTQDASLKAESKAN